MHNIEIRQEIIDRVLARRGRFHLFENLAPADTALVVIDMQSTFVEPGSPAEVPASRGIVDNINSCAAELRALGGTVIWVNHANAHNSSASDWDMFFNHFVSEDIRKKTIESLSPDGEGQKVWHELNVEKDDLHIIKNRYSALISGSSSLERTLRSRGITNLLIAGTKTNVCCEATARDAMMLDFKTVMVKDCLGALSDDEHRATLETFIQQFGDVMSSDEVLAILRQHNNQKSD
jgi:ureidoacrylate peracid hydrolase